MQKLQEVPLLVWKTFEVAFNKKKKKIMFKTQNINVPNTW